MVEERESAFIIMNPQAPTCFVYIGAGRATFWRPDSKPGDRRPGYYAAFLLDPDDNNIEAGIRQR